MTAIGTNDFIDCAADEYDGPDVDRHLNHRPSAAGGPGGDLEHRLPSGRTLTPGTQLRVRGWRGEFRFMYATANGELVVYGGPAGRGLTRTLADGSRIVVKRTQRQAVDA